MKRKRNGCGIMGAVAILSIIYYAIAIPLLIRKPRTEYYGPAGLAISQCGPAGCAPQYQQASSGFTWTAGAAPWKLEQGGRFLGTLGADGVFRDAAGTVAPCPADWYSSDIRAVGADKPKEVAKPIGDTLPPTGVDPREMAKSRLKNPTGYMIGDREITADMAYSSVQGHGPLKSLLHGKRIVIMGVDAKAREAFIGKLKNLPPDVIVSEYDPNKPEDLWHVKPHWEASVAKKPELLSAGAVAWVLNEENEQNRIKEQVAWAPGELTKAVSALRPKSLPDTFDIDKATVDSGVMGSWPLNTSQTYSVLIIAVGVITSILFKRPE
ncbi:MAG TPA: hypothetical protein PLN21_09260 [Gemmatales bacterium]|nr:hypothetical protein [Gemmatales bacterium]